MRKTACQQRLCVGLEHLRVGAPGVREPDPKRAEFTDSLGTVHVRWDGGRHCGIITEAAHMIRKLSREAEQREPASGPGPSSRVSAGPGG